MDASSKLKRTDEAFILRIVQPAAIQLWLQRVRLPSRFDNSSRSVAIRRDHTPVVSFQTQADSP